MELRCRVRWVVAVLLAGCGPSAAPNPCTPGLAVSCPCLGGASGVQTCGPSGTYGACVCLDASTPPPDVAAPEDRAPPGKDVATEASRPDDGPADAPSGSDAPPDAPDRDVPPKADASLDVGPDVTPDVSPDAVTGADAFDAPAALDAPDASGVPDAATTPDALLDVSDVQDGGVTPEASVDVTDGDVGGAVDGSVCPAGAPLDLNTVGTLSGGVTRYTGRLRPAGVTSSACRNNVTHFVPLRYTLRTRAALRVSTDNPGTPTNVDTVLWATESCASFASAASALACVDDNGTPPRGYASTMTLGIFPSGTTVHVFVGAFPHTSPTTYDNTGPFELTVTELPIAPIGGACGTAAAAVCDPPSVCSIATGVANTCVREGAFGGRCRSGAPACDAGLACNVLGASDTFCRNASVPVGGVCDGSFLVCAAGATCRSSSFGTPQRCAAAGQLGGACRATGALCDAGLQCTGSVCRTVVRLGETCPVSIDGSSVCETGTRCIPNEGTSTVGTCRADGLAQGACRTTTPLCDPMLECATAPSAGRSLCLPLLTAGALCGPSDRIGVCPRSSLRCATQGAERRCANQGAAGGYCIDARLNFMTFCRDGLSCTNYQDSLNGACLPTVAYGGACDPMQLTNACALGSQCVTTGGASTCQTAYTITPLAAPTYIDPCPGGMSRLVSDGSATITLPFPVRIYGGIQGTIYASPRGFATFGGATHSGYVPLQAAGGAVMPYYSQSLQSAFVSGLTTPTMCWRTDGAAPNRTFALAWVNQRVTYTTANATRLTFEVIFREASPVIDFVYDTLSATNPTDLRSVDGSFAAIGIDVPAMSTQPPTFHRATVSSRSGLRFTPR